MKKFTICMILVLAIVMVAALSTAALAATTEAAAPDLVGTAIEIVAGVVQTALLGLVALAFAAAQKNTKSERLKTALGSLEQAANKTVLALQETAVEKLKTAAKNGKLTKSEIDALTKESIALIRDRMGVDAQNVIMAAGLDLGDMITAEYKAAITRMKQQIAVQTGVAILENGTFISPGAGGSAVVSK